MNTTTPVTFHFSKLNIVRQYVAMQNQLLSLRPSLEQAAAAIAPLQEAETAARHIHQEEQTNMRVLHAEAKVLREAKEKEVAALEDEYEDAAPMVNIHRRSPLGALPYSSIDCRFGYDAHAAWVRYKDAFAEMWDLKKACYASTPEADAANNALESATSLLSAAQRARQTIERQIKEAEDKLTDLATQLPAGALNLPIDTLAAAGTLSTQGSDLPYWHPEGSSAEIAGMLRGELPTGCGGRCDGGYVRVPSNHNGIDFIADDEIRHPLCYNVEHFDVDRLLDVVPIPHQKHRLHSLRPWERSPIPVETQTDIIADMASCSEDLNGWLMVGAAGTSKTTYAAAAVVDMLTFRIAQHPATTPLNYWRLKVPKWTRDMEAWEQRRFDDTSTPEPSTTPHAIEVITKKSGLAPILWLEELDKFNPTTNRMRNLYCLIDAVYECGGTIISTSNMKLKELKEHLGDPIYRRLTGENDSAENFKVWDFWRASGRPAARGPQAAPKKVLKVVAPKKPMKKRTW